MPQRGKAETADVPSSVSDIFLSVADRVHKRAEDGEPMNLVKILIMLARAFEEELEVADSLKATGLARLWQARVRIIKDAAVRAERERIG